MNNYFDSPFKGVPLDQQVAWWNWPIEQIKAHVLDIMNGDKMALESCR